MVEPSYISLLQFVYIRVVMARTVDFCKD